MRAGSYRPPKIERVVFGTPYLDAASAIVEETGARRVFVLASRTLNRTTPIVDDLRRALGARHAATFDAIPSHTPRDAVVAAANAARDAGADLLVTIGGGSLTDAAKVVQLCLSNDVREDAQLDALRTRRGQPLPASIAAPTVRSIAIPTTMSAGEFMAYAGVTNRATGVKETFFHPLSVPAFVILDPAVTLPTPMDLWLSTGIRALDHAVEGYLSRRRSRTPRRPTCRRCGCCGGAAPLPRGAVGPRSALRLPDGDVAVHGRLAVRRAEGRQPCDRAPARQLGRLCRTASRPA